MILRYLEGEDQINAFAMQVMEHTVQRLVAENLCDPKAAEAFLDTHICLLAPHDGPLRRWIQRNFCDEPGASKIIIAKVGL
jgi:hypothetical protein